MACDGQPAGRSADVDARLTGALLAAWLAIGCAIRLSGLEAYALSPDDALHVAEARLDSTAALLEALAREDTHPPLHYLLLHALSRLGGGESALRAASLLPSLLLIPLLYALGRRVAGRAAGLFAAFLVGFAPTSVLQAQVIRPYALELLLLSAALWLLLGSGQSPGRTRLLGYGALAALAVLAQYSAVIAIASVACVEGLRLARGGRLRALAEWAALHAGLALLTLGLLSGLIAAVLGSEFRRQAVDGWLAAGFPGGDYLVFWLQRSLAQLVYFADPPDPVPGALLAGLLVVGCVPRRGHARWLAATLLLASWLNLLLAAQGLYPLSASRHSLYLLPFVAVLAGAGVQTLWDRLPLPPEPARALAVGSVLVLTLLAGLRGLAQNPARSVVGIAERPLLREHYTATLAHLEASADRDELLVGDKQLAYYAWLEGSLAESELLSPAVGRTRLGGRDFYYYEPARALATAADLARFLDELERVVEDPPARLRLASLGWRSGLLYRLTLPELADLDPQPGDAALRRALARAGVRTFSAGQLAGGGIAFATDWSTLRAGLATAGQGRAPEPDAARPARDPAR